MPACGLRLLTRVGAGHFQVWCLRRPRNARRPDQGAPTRADRLEFSLTYGRWLTRARGLASPLPALLPCHTGRGGQGQGGAGHPSGRSESAKGIGGRDPAAAHPGSQRFHAGEAQAASTTRRWRRRHCQGAAVKSRTLRLLVKSQASCTPSTQHKVTEILRTSRRLKMTMDAQAATAEGAHRVAGSPAKQSAAAGHARNWLCLPSPPGWTGINMPRGPSEGARAALIGVGALLRQASSGRRGPLLRAAPFCYGKTRLTALASAAATALQIKTRRYPR